MKLLYGIQSTGNGHINRALPLVETLKAQGHEVDILFSGPAKQDWQLTAFAPFEQRMGLSFVHKHGKIALLATCRNIKWRHFKRDVHELDVTPYDLILTDFESITAWAGRRANKYTIGIGRQYAFYYDVPFPKRAWLSRWITRQFAPVNTAVGMHWHHFNQPLVPPVIKPLDEPLHEHDLITVYMPFEHVDTVTQLLQRFDKYRFNVFHPNIHQHSEQGHITLNPLAKDAFTDSLTRCQPPSPSSAK